MQATNVQPRSREGIAGIRKLAFSTVVLAVLLLLAAGTVRWVWGWIYLAVVGAVVGFYGRTLLTLHPDLIEERHRPPAGAKAWDKPLVAIVGVVGPLVLLVSAGLDHRLGWSPPASAGWHLAGLAMVAVGGAITNWAIVHNRFFSGLIRIQHDRGHVVVSSGPYARVRHPGYSGAILHTFGTTLALGSWWSLALVAVPIVVTICVRTALEDRTLRAELAGYEDYARRVRFRLVPGLW